VLDIGCGAGILAEGLAAVGFKNILGIDPTPKCIELAQAHLDDKNPLKDFISYKNMSLEDLILERQDNQQKFDLVCCSEVIEHVQN
jgi:2-polyprenyl-3-methyl-5-hydroxy-6-metoxy-1,4-benzoquinol methylase